MAAMKVKTNRYIKNFGMAKLFGLFYKQDRVREYLI